MLLFVVFAIQSACHSCLIVARTDLGRYDVGDSIVTYRHSNAPCVRIEGFHEASLRRKHVTGSLCRQIPGKVDKDITYCRPWNTEQGMHRSQSLRKLPVNRPIYPIHVEHLRAENTYVGGTSTRFFAAADWRDRALLVLLKSFCIFPAPPIRGLF